MSNSLAIYETQLTQLRPRFDAALGGTGLTGDRIKQSVLVSLERTPTLLQCTPVSVMQAAMSAAVLGLLVDGVTGQAFLVPFKGRAQLIIGYKGFNTMAGRDGVTITGGLAREGDEFDFELGSRGFIRHRPKLTGDRGRQIIAAWALAQAAGRPDIPVVMSYADVLAIKERAPGARKADSPWNDHQGPGHAAMCEKTAKRRLARSLPLGSLVRGARMDEAHEEQGAYAWIDPQRGVIIEHPSEPGDGEPAAPPLIGTSSPAFTVLLQDGERSFATIEQWRSWLLDNLGKIRSLEQLKAFAERNRDLFRALYDDHSGAVSDVLAEIARLETDLQASAGEGEAA